MAEEEEVLGKISDETYELDSDTKDEVAEKSQKYVPFWKLYRYAKCLDILLIIFALVCGVLSGVSYPAQIYILGITFNEFIDHAVIDAIKSGNYTEITNDHYTQSDTVTSDNNTQFDTVTTSNYTQFDNITSGNYTQFDTVTTGNYTQFDNITSGNYTPMTPEDYGYFCDVTKQSNLREYYFSDDPDGYLLDRTTTYAYYTIGISLVFFVCAAMSRFLWTFSAARQARSMRLNYLKSVLTRHVGWFDINPSTELPTHLSQAIQNIESAIGRSIVTVIENFITFLSCFAIAFYVNWELAAVTASLLPPLFLLAYIIGKIISIFTAKKQIALGKAGSVAEEVIASIKTVKAFGGQDKENERYHSQLKQAKRKSFVILFLVATILAIFTMMIAIYHAVGYWYGIGLFVDCDITAGEMFLIVAEIVVGSFTFADLVPELTDLFAAIGSASVVFGVIDQTSEINPDSEDGIIPDTVDGSVQLSNVRFSYPSRPDVEVLHGLDLSVRPGQTVALVGSSGSGKSTVVRLIPRIYDITTGSVSLDGIDVRDLNIKWLRNQIGVVSQEPVLFNVSIAENISYGKEDATVEEIEMAAKSANAHNFICDLPDGYDTLVGDGGSQLSGGQKQRIAIARALVNDPKILLLDEATSALDTESEKVVQDALDKARRGRTTIVIAHRLSTIQTSDVIVAIDKGNVVEFGSHSELMKKEGLYYQLVMNQTIEESTEEEDKDFPQTLKATLDEPVGKTLLSSTDEFSKVIEQDSDTEEEETEDSPLLLKKSVSTIDTKTQDKEIQALPLMYLMILCFKQIHWFFLVLALIISTTSGAAFAVTYYLFNGVAVYVSKTDKDEVLWGVHMYALLFVAMGVLQLFLTFFSINTLGFCEEHVVETVRQKSFQTILKRHMSWFDRTENSVSALSHRLSVEASNIDQAFDVKVGHAYKSTIAVSVSIIIAFIMSWVVALVILPAFPLMILGGFIQLVLTKRYTDQRNGLIEDSAKVAIEAIENVYTVATLGIETRLVRKYDDLLELPLKIDLKSITVNSIVYSFSQAILPIAIGVGYIAGAYIYTSDEDEVYYASYADVFTAILTIWFTGNIIKRFFSVLPDSQSAALSARSFLKLVSQHAAVENLEDGIIPDEVNGDFKIQQLHFVYPARPEVTVLKNVDVSVSAGHTLALVGHSGSGKSTIISLTERFYDPTTGSILLDGHNLHDVNLAWLRSQISLVSQEPVLFDMSIADNIRYGANFREVTDNEVIEAAKSANIHKFIQSLPQGYNTNVGLKGTQLSGGQKQRVAIARALVRDPKILLLDEATSALDTESEKIVQDALDKAKEGRTTIIIAHRLSTIYNSDCIVVLHNGSVIEQGTHAELLARQGLYYFMNNIQKQET